MNCRNPFEPDRADLETARVLAALAHEGLDLIEVSGGSYEQPAMMGKAAASTRAREAYFLEYARYAASLATFRWRSRAASVLKPRCTKQCMPVSATSSVWADGPRQRQMPPT